MKRIARRPFPSRTAPGSRIPLCGACECVAVHRSEVSTIGKHWCRFHRGNDVAKPCPECGINDRALRRALRPSVDA